ncbi:MAG TPA: matrixin family metalloprotease [bacterium]|nr:matrixin family metalloprotease [bacterium]
MAAAAAVVAAPAPSPAASSAVAGTAHAIVFLQPLGKDLPDADVEMVATALREFYAIDVRTLARVDLPQEAWYPPRKRWRAEKILAFLKDRVPERGDHILGLTQADVSTTKGEYEDWGVMGLGDLDGATSVISSFRCHKKSTGAKNARERLAKTAVHEMGHNLGLDHCPNAGCLMHDAEGQVTETDGDYDLCEHCRGLLRDAGRAIPEHPKIPWSKP